MSLQPHQACRSLIHTALYTFSCNQQIMVDKDVAEEVGGLKQLTPTSTCVLIEGVLAQTPPGTKQKVRSCGDVVVVLLQMQRAGADFAQQ